jgi:hypothetical protein
VSVEATTLAGAFVVGLLAGTILTVRLTRVIADHWRRRVDRPDQE